MNELFTDWMIKTQGFKAGDAKAHQDDANDPETGEGSLSHNGDYVVEGLFTKGDVQVLIERNTSPDDPDGDVVRRHPPCVVISSPKGRAACNPSDIEAIEAEIKRLS